MNVEFLEVHTDPWLILQNIANFPYGEYSVLLAIKVRFTNTNQTIYLNKNNNFFLQYFLTVFSYSIFLQYYSIFLQYFQYFLTVFLTIPTTYNSEYWISCSFISILLLTRMYWLDRWIVRKQLGIIPTYHYVQNQGKLMMWSRENGQKPQLEEVFDNFKIKYLKIENFSEKQVSFKLKVIFSTDFRPQTKKIVRAVFENISVWFWANLGTFLQISLNQEFFSKIRLSDFSTFIVP